MSGLVSFAIDIKAFSGTLGAVERKSIKRWKRNLRVIGWQLHSLTVDRTPIDTGQAKRSWGMAPNTDDLDSKMEVSVRSHTAEYIVALEYGHSRQAPAGMLRVSMRDIARSFGRSIFKK